MLVYRVNVVVGGTKFGTTYLETCSDKPRFRDIESLQTNIDRIKHDLRNSQEVEPGTASFVKF